MKIRMSKIIVLSGLVLITAGPAFAQLMSKAQVGNLIAKVEDGVDDFRDYLKDRGENTKDRASRAKAQGATTRRKATDAQKANATAKKEKDSKRLFHNSAPFRYQSPGESSRPSATLST